MIISISVFFSIMDVLTSLLWTRAPQKVSLVLQDRAMHTDFWKSFPREASWHGIQITFLLACNIHE